MMIFKRLLMDEEGQGMVEYALIIALVAVVLIVALLALSGTIGDIFSSVDEGIESTTAAP